MVVAARLAVNVLDGVRVEVAHKATGKPLMRQGYKDSAYFTTVINFGHGFAVFVFYTKRGVIKVNLDYELHFSYLFVVMCLGFHRVFPSVLGLKDIHLS